VLRLGPGISEYYLPFIEAEYPELAERYRRLYPGNYAPAQYGEAVKRRVEELQARYGLEREAVRTKERARPPTRPVQMLLFSASRA
jgi:hypothetical protein